MLETIIKKAQLRHVLIIMLLLMSPALFSGLMGDDLFHYALLNGAASFPQPNDISLFNLFSFINDDPVRRAVLQDMSIMSWWISPTFQWNFWRPLAELTHYIDYVWLKDFVWLMHLHSLVYFVIIVNLVYQLCLLIFKEQKLALLITALYALSATHGMTVAWLSNRNALLALLFALLSLITFIKSQQQCNFKQYALSLVFLIPALLSGEIALSLGAFLFAYTVTLSTKSVSQGIVLLLPHLFIVIIWYSLYTQAGFGAHGNTLFYINPTQHPTTYLSLLIERIPAISVSLLLALPVDVLGNIPIIKWFLMVFFFFLSIYTYQLLKHSAFKKQALFFAIAGIIAIFPIACSPPQSRNLIFVSLTSSVIVGLILLTLYKQKFSKNKSWMLTILLSLHLIFSPLLLLPSSYIPKLFSTAGEKRASSFDVLAEDHVIVLDADMMELTYLAATLFKQGAVLPARVWNLTGAEAQYSIEKIDDYRLRLQAKEHFLSEADLLVRNIAVEPFHSDDTIIMNGLTIDIKSVDEKGFPTVIETTFTKKISHLKIMQWQKTGYKQLSEQKMLTQFKP